MTTPRTYSFARYLAAKRTVDDRALNAGVRARLLAELPAVSQFRPLRVLEVGAGIGTMIERALEWGLPRFADYLAIDADDLLVAEARRRLPARAEALGWRAGPLADGGWQMFRDRMAMRVAVETADVREFVARPDVEASRDLLIAHAFLDLVDAPSLLPRLCRCLCPGGLAYLTLNFDGATILEPCLEPGLDARIEALYHATMDHRRVDGAPSGDSRTGRRLFQWLRRSGATLLAAGASDWVVFAGPNGYPADEAYFLHHIVGTIAGALAHEPALDSPAFARWVAERHVQIDRGELVYVAHQLDLLARVGPG